MFEAGRGEPAEPLLRQDLAVSPIVLPAHDHRIQRALVERIHWISRGFDARFNPKGRIVSVKPRQQNRQLRTSDLIRDSEGEAAGC
jgi:hypothetical protein